MKIAHIADLHIRGLSRHDEMRIVIQALIDDLKNKYVKHLVIAGDLFHTKTTGISPEYISFLTECLDKLSKEVIVHITLGNHDGNMSNLSRLDAITPIVNAMNNKNIHLYKDSGNYEIDKGIILNNFGIFDKGNWDKVKPQENSINIASYHGPVYGAKTESNWNIKGDLNVEFFKDYDFVMLGDIHEYQELSTRKTYFGEEKAWICYPGSLLQQSYGESLEHGYLLWDIKDKDDWDVSFNILPNPHPFVTIEWTNDIKEFSEIVSKLPKKSRIRIKSNSKLTQQELNKIYSITNKITPTEITYKIDESISNDIISLNGEYSLIKEDLRKSSVLIRLMKEYYKDLKYTVLDNEWSIIKEQLDLYLDKISNDSDVVRNTKWNLKHLEFDNLYGYGENNSINFESLEGVTGIFGPNRSGKSSIPATILYTLFNSSDRGSIKNLHIMNTRKDFCKGRAMFSVNGIDYIVERQTIKNEATKKRSVSAVTNLNMFRIEEDGKLTDLVGEQRSTTDKSIRKLIGSVDDFLLTTFSAQGDHNKFINEGDTQRKMILARFLDLDMFETIHDLVKKNLNDTKILIKNIPSHNWEKEIDEKSSLKKKLIISLEELTNKISETRDKLDHIKSDIAKNSNTTIVTQIQLTNQKSKVNSIEKQLKIAEHELEELNNIISSKKTKLEKINELKNEVDINTLKNKLDSYRIIESSVKDIKHQYQLENDLLSRQNKSIKQLKTVPCGDNFPTCKFIKDSYNDKNQIESQKEKVEKLFNKLTDIEKSLDILKSENIIDKIQKYEKINSLETQLQIELSKHDSEVHKLEMAISMYKASYEKENLILESYNEAINNEENAELILLKKEVDNLNLKINQLESKKTQTATDIGRLESEIEKLNKLYIEYTNLQTKLKYYELITNAFCKKGIPANIINSQMPVINSEIAKILHGIVDFTIELEVDTETNEVPIYINYGDSRRIIELCSGMEKMISSIAIRTALLNISSLPKTDIFIIDEGFGALDEFGVEACNRLLSSLKKYFKNILVISHVDGIKDSADNIIEITKNEKNSFIRYE